jgi:hypothetical protein
MSKIESLVEVYLIAERALGALYPTAVLSRWAAPSSTRRWANVGNGRG